MEKTRRFIPVKRAAIDGRIWWLVYDNQEKHFSTLLCFGKYRTKKECQYKIDYVENTLSVLHPDIYKITPFYIIDKK